MQVTLAHARILDLDKTFIRSKLSRIWNGVSREDSQWFATSVDLSYALDAGECFLKLEGHVGSQVDGSEAARWTVFICNDIKRSNRRCITVSGPLVVSLRRLYVGRSIKSGPVLGTG